jgi:hypothetical protein
MPQNRLVGGVLARQIKGRKEIYMNEYTDQIAGYFNKVPMWPLALLGVGIVIAGIYELIHRKQHAAAVDEFRAAILSTLSGLYPEPTHWPKSIDTYLRARLPVMQEIIENFRSDLPQEQIKAYNEDWDHYYQFCRFEVTDEKCESAEANPAEPDPKKKFRALVSNLLHYAK